MAISYSRHKFVDFTIGFFEEPTAILIPPPAEDAKLFACIKPFQMQVNLYHFQLVTGYDSTFGTFRCGAVYCSSSPCSRYFNGFRSSCCGGQRNSSDRPNRHLQSSRILNYPSSIFSSQPCSVSSVSWTSF